MGFSGGGSSQTKPHTHDSNIVNDGGSLNFDNITQGSLTAGDVVYSDGTHFQRLAIGGAGSTLAVNGGATAPEWASASAGAWILEGNDVATSFQSELAVSVSDADVYQINYNVSDGGGDYNALVMRINDITTSTYKALLSQGVASGGSQGDPELTTQDKCMITGESIERQCNGTIYVYKGNSNFYTGVQGVNYINQGVQNSTSDPYNWQIGGGNNSTITGAINKLSLLFMKTTSTANENIEGSMRVNSLTYS